MNRYRLQTLVGSAIATRLRAATLSLRIAEAMQRAEGADKAALAEALDMAHAGCEQFRGAADRLAKMGVAHDRVA